MGSAEGFGGGVVVTEVGRLSGGACSSGVKKGELLEGVWTFVLGFGFGCVCIEIVIT